MESIHSTKAPKAIGPYAQAIRSGNLLFCSGKTPINPQAMEIEGNDIQTLTQRVLKNLEAVLNEAGLTLRHVIKTNVFLSDMQLFPEMNETYEICFNGHKPACSTVAVKGLPLNALIEIELIAEIN
ncbi:Rid family detoxifying hydrolase [Fulvivirga ulvae]|uniref:Rid family detoxifying hydrolase n=1 Tax=Fulvivirga ulvae TaxID=2904245 RepID=UPI001F37F677|nr:Rid family detoxifying hydrolase [Fulvivirga ulvae]UII33648.1 Rid family detoxifying hydrolase [Fulvivirga ulvae]